MRFLRCGACISGTEHTDCAILAGGKRGAYRPPFLERPK